MGSSHVVPPATVRLTLSSGDTVDVKKELNAGENWDLMIALADRQAFARILAYVTGWSLVGLDGQPLPYSLDLPETTRRDTIRALNKRIVRELQAALDRHELAEDLAVAAKKKADSGPSAAPAS